MASPPTRSAQTEDADAVDALLASSRGTTAAGERSRFSAILDLAATAADIVGTPLSGRHARRRWVVRESGGDLTLQRFERGVAGPIAPFPPTGTPGVRRAAVRAGDSVELRLDPDRIIVQRLSLPAESRGFVQAVIDHRLDRLTPWKPEDVVYGFTVAPETAASIAVEFAGTSKLIARDALQRLVALGLRATAIGSAAEPAARPLVIDLLRGRGDRRLALRRRRLRILCLALLPAMLAVFLFSLWLRLEAEARLDTAGLQLDAERRAVQARGAAGGADDDVLALIGTKRLDEAAFHLVDRLAAIVPADTFLSDLEIAPGSLRLKGSSADAPALVPVLEAEPNLEAVRFESPVLREAGGRDRFDVVATLTRANAAAGKP